MNTEIQLTQKSDGILLLQTGGRSARVCTVAQAAASLKRTRRQVYRYIETGLLRPEAKMLGEWLLDAAEVEKAALRPRTAQPLPEKLSHLFPEYDLSGLNAGRDKTLVIARVLESGGRAEIDWAFKRYGRAELASFVKEDGSRLLGARSLRLWALVLGAVPVPLPEWRRSGIWRA